MATTYINTANMGTTNTYTISLWLKRSGLSSTQRLFTPFEATENDQEGIYFGSDDTLNMKKSGSGGVATSSAVFRDTSGWYHLCFQNDAGAAEYWINGVSQGTTTGFPASAAGAGRFGNKVGGSEYFDGLMSYIIYSDGTAYAPTVFGSTDADTGEWVINTNPTVTYGSQGFFILKNGNSVTDQSGNGNNATTSGAGLTNTEDCPDDVFNTWNALAQPNGTLSNGNTSNLSTEDTPGTLGVNKGKFYWEIKRTNTTDSIHYGICSSKRGFNKTTKQFLNGETDSVGASIYVSEAGTGATSYADSNGAFSSTSYSGVSTPSIANGDVIGMALDISTSSGTIEWFNNGVSFGSATFTYDDSVFVFPFIRLNSGATSDCNFGNGYFGTTIISSEGTNASNIGKFEYDVPTGFTALSAKGMNS